MTKTNTKYLTQAVDPWPRFGASSRKRAQIYLDRYKEMQSNKSKRGAADNRRFSRNARFKAVAAAYAHFIVLSNNKERESIVKVLMKKAGLKLDGRSDYLGMLCDLYIGYQGAADQKNLRSRDATAIRFLISQGVHPDEVLKYKLAGERGVVVWAHAWGELRNPKPTAVTPGAKTNASATVARSTGKGLK
jgi:hypothetical protein